MALCWPYYVRTRVAYAVISISPRATALAGGDVKTIAGSEQYPCAFPPHCKSLTPRRGDTVDAPAKLLTGGNTQRNASQKSTFRVEGPGAALVWLLTAKYAVACSFAH